MDPSLKGKYNRKILLLMPTEKTGDLLWSVLKGENFVALSWPENI